MRSDKNGVSDEEVKNKDAKPNYFSLLCPQHLALGREISAAMVEVYSHEMGWFLQECRQRTRRHIFGAIKIMECDANCIMS